MSKPSAVPADERVTQFDLERYARLRMERDAAEKALDEEKARLKAMLQAGAEIEPGARTARLIEYPTVGWKQVVLRKLGQAYVEWVEARATRAVRLEIR